MSKSEKETEDINEFAISWDNLSEDLRSAILNFDNGRVALILLKEHPDMSIDEACDTANVLVKIHTKRMGFSEEVH